VNRRSTDRRALIPAVGAARVRTTPMGVRKRLGQLP
jgi:hypothetical protein